MPSAVIKAYDYDPEKEILEITYHSGKFYHYLNVSEKVYQEMPSTMVKGIWFNRHIKGKYPFKEVTPGLQQADLFKPDHWLPQHGYPQLLSLRNIIHY